MKSDSRKAPTLTEALANLRAIRHNWFSNLRATDKGLIDTSVEAGPATPDDVLATGMSSLVGATVAGPPQPIYNGNTTSAWRMLEEQRYRALDVVRECEAEIAKWSERRDDAQRAADGCAAGQRAMERQ